MLFWEKLCYGCGAVCELILIQLHINISMTISWTNSCFSIVCPRSSSQLHMAGASTLMIVSSFFFLFFFFFFLFLKMTVHYGNSINEL